MKALLGKKLGMAQIFDENGKVIPITLIFASPSRILQRKTKEKDGYEALQIGFEEITKESKQAKSAKGKQFRHIREFSEMGGGEEYKEGDSVSVSVFQEGDKVRVSSISKGKGFQGGVKRWGFAGRNATHGVKHEQRTIGSVGGRFPQRVVKGRKMPGHMGRERVTVQNLKVAKIDTTNHVIALKGAVPGSRGTLIEIQAI